MNSNKNEIKLIILAGLISALTSFIVSSYVNKQVINETNFTNLKIQKTEILGLNVIDYQQFVWMNCEIPDDEIVISEEMKEII